MCVCVRVCVCCKFGRCTNFSEGVSSKALRIPWLIYELVFCHNSFTYSWQKGILFLFERLHFHTMGRTVLGPLYCINFLFHNSLDHYPCTWAHDFWAASPEHNFAQLCNIKAETSSVSSVPCSSFPLCVIVLWFTEKMFSYESAPIERTSLAEIFNHLSDVGCNKDCRVYSRIQKEGKYICPLQHFCGILFHEKWCQKNNVWGIQKKIQKVTKILIWRMMLLLEVFFWYCFLDHFLWFV